VILQHAPNRPWFLGQEGRSAIPPVAGEIDLVRRLGSEVWAVTLNVGEAPADEAMRIRDRLRGELACPVLLGREDADDLAALVRERIRS